MLFVEYTDNQGSCCVYLTLPKVMEVNMVRFNLAFYPQIVVISVDNFVSPLPLYEEVREVCWLKYQHVVTNLEHFILCHNILAFCPITKIL